MNPYAFPPIIVSLGTLFLGLFVLSRNVHSVVHRGLFLFCLCGSIWLLAYGLMFTQERSSLAFLFARIGYSGVVFIPSTCFHFIVDLLKAKSYRRWCTGGYLISVSFTILLWGSTWFISSVRKYLWGYYPIAGIAHPLFLFWMSFTFVITTSELVKHIVGRGKRMLAASEVETARLVVWALLVCWLACIDFLPNYGIEVYPCGYVFIACFVVTISYTIARHQLFDIRVELTKTSLLLCVYLIVLGLPFVVASLGRSRLERQLSQEWWLVPLGLSTVLATAGPFAYAYLRRQAEGRLLRDQRRYQRTLQRAARGMTQVRDLTKLSHLITRVVSRSVRIAHASLFLWDKTSERYVLRSSHGPRRLSLQSRYTLEPSHGLVKWLGDHRRVLVEDDYGSDSDSTIGEEMRNLGAELAVPGLIEQRLIGFLALGGKLSGAGYSADDLHAFTTLANEAAIAIENATSYEELLKVNEQLKSASERLLIQERLAAAGQFAAGMAHEIKNPLASIKTFVEYLPEKYADPAFREKFFGLVQSEIDRINEIVRELSDFAKPAPPQLKPVQLSDLVEDTLALLSNQCLKQGIEVQKSFCDNRLHVKADPQQLKQVLLNLLLNSLESMVDGGKLYVSTGRDHDRLTLRIADTGCGISTEQQRHVWDPFFTTKERGMGLGLAIVKGIIERHGGQISLSSAVGKGTTVEVVLPILDSF